MPWNKIILSRQSRGTITTENKRLQTTTRIACNLLSLYVQCGRYDTNLSFQLDYQPGSSPFNLYFRAVLAHHMMRFSSHSRSAEAAVPKMYPQFQSFHPTKNHAFFCFPVYVIASFSVSKYRQYWFILIPSALECSARERWRLFGILSLNCPE